MNKVIIEFRNKMFVMKTNLSKEKLKEALHKDAEIILFEEEKK